MNSFLDRKLQKLLLEKLAVSYPQVSSLRDMIELTPDDNKTDSLAVNLAYLDEHGLIDFTWSETIGGKYPIMGTITAKGLDFLADDGGLTAILGVLTVKLHEDTIKELMIAKIEQSDTDSTVKKNLIDAVKKLPADAMKELSMAAVRQGIGNLPNAVQWFQKWLGY